MVRDAMLQSSQGGSINNSIKSAPGIHETLPRGSMGIVYCSPLALGTSLTRDGGREMNPSLE